MTSEHLKQSISFHLNSSSGVPAYLQLVEQGTYIVRRPKGPGPDIQLRLARRLDQWVKAARADGLDDESIESMVRDTLNRSNVQRIA